MATVVDRIKQFNKNLLPDMVQLKYKAMSESGFRFFRGTCHLFYEDLSHVNKFPDSPLTWICGDLHLENFGSFKGNNRMEYFDLNDFDEAILAPLNWELARVLTSIYVAFDSLKLKEEEATEMATTFLEKYIETLKAGKAYYIDPRTAKGIVRDFLKAVKKQNETVFLSNIINIKKHQLTIKINNTTHFRIKEGLKKDLMELLRNWIEKTDTWPNNYKVKDAAFRVAGTGSVGLKRYMFLLQNKGNKNKFLLLELKEATKSSLSPYTSVPQPAWTSDAQRVIIIKQRMQNISPALTSTIVFKGVNYILQEMQPMADKINFETIANNQKGLKCVLNDMAMLTASAQIRSGGIQGSAIIDQLSDFGYQNEWKKNLLAYAKTYAEKVKKDYQQFITAYKKSLLNN